MEWTNITFFQSFWPLESHSSVGAHIHVPIRRSVGNLELGVRVLLAEASIDIEGYSCKKDRYSSFFSCAGKHWLLSKRIHRSLISLRVALRCHTARSTTPSLSLLLLHSHLSQQPGKHWLKKMFPFQNSYPWWHCLKNPICVWARRQ